MAQDLPDEMFRWIVEAMPAAIVYAGREGLIRLWNRGAEIVFGYPREDALGHTLDLIIPERWRARHREGYDRVMQTGVIEFSIILPRGRDRQVLGAVAIVRDVTARREREQALRKKLAPLEAAGGTTEGDFR